MGVEKKIAIRPELLHWKYGAGWLWGKHMEQHTGLAILHLRARRDMKVEKTRKVQKELLR